MAQQIEYTEEQIKKASYPEPKNVLIYSEIPIKRLDTPLGRVYYHINAEPKDRVYIYSSTTILSNTLAKGKAFDMWLGNSNSYKDAMDYAHERAFVGSMSHALIMFLIWGKTVDTDNGFYDQDSGKIVPVPDEVKLRLQGFLDFYYEYKPKPLATEIALYDHTRDENGDLLYPWAGTADQIMHIDGKLWLVDIKTGKEHPKDHALQLTSYKMLWDHLYGDQHGKIDVLACLYITKTGKYKLKKYKFVPLDWCHVYSNFEYIVKDGFGRMPKIKEKEELPTIYKIEGEVK